MADLSRAFFGSDLCVLNSGTLRHDSVIKRGKLNYSVVSNFINDILVVKEVTGAVILEMLEFSVCNLP